RGRFPAIPRSAVPIQAQSATGREPVGAFSSAVSNRAFVPLRSTSAMDLDPLEMVAEPSGFGDDDADTTSAAQHRRHARLNAAVAITVALLATFMGICKIKDDNICQAMQQAQAAKIDDWSFYQARNVRQEVAQAELTNLS